MMELEKILHKYLNGNATNAEIERLKSDSEYSTYVAISETTATLGAPDFNETKTFDAIQGSNYTAPKVKRLNPLRTVIKIAALIAVLAAGYIFVSSLDSTFTTEIAQKENITLPDSSKVILNANSELTYNRGNWNTERVLELNGEAYFKVTKGNTFSVETSQGTVTVLGTQFNVYSRDTIFNVVCYEGLVSVSFNDETIKLPAGNKLKIENKKLILNTQSAKLLPVWIGNESSFDNATLGTVINELRAQYPISITAPNYINAKRFTGSFTHTNLENALRAVCAPLQLEFTIDGDQVRIYAKGEK